MEPRARQAPPAGVRAQQQGQEDNPKAREAESHSSPYQDVLLAEPVAVHPEHYGVPGVLRPQSDFPGLGHRLLPDRGRGRGPATERRAQRHLDDTLQAGYCRVPASWIQTGLAAGDEVPGRVLRAHLQEGWIFFLLSGIEKY